MTSLNEPDRPEPGPGGLFDRIRREGPVRFDAAVEAMLYGDGGFFASGGGAGRRADFLTSPEVGPLFGAVLARALDDEWRRLGRPDPFVVVEGGAGRGALARSVLDAAPTCLRALRYVCVERSASLRALAEDALPVEPAANVFGPVLQGDDAEEEPEVAHGGGPVVVVLDDLPLVRITGVVIANELLDNLPFRLVERMPSGWGEVLVGLGTGGLHEVLVPAPADLADEADRFAPEAGTGARLPLQHEAAAWLRRALALLERGRVVAVDYADSSASLVSRPWQEWLRTYRAHSRGGGPLDDPGHQDVTCEVALDQLARVARPSAESTQAAWLAAHGIGELVAEAEANWQARAHIGDLDALRARSRVTEGAALTDPTGLGAFWVQEWVV